MFGADVSTTDVLVVGAGPAGVAAAVTLARAGRDVTVVDKAVFPRDKCCGDGLTTLALRELQALGFDPGAVVDWRVVGDAVLRAPSGRQVTVPLPHGAGTYAAVAPRLQLDAALVDVAAKAGARIVQGHAVTGIVDGVDGRGVRTTTDRVVATLHGHAPIAARYVVAADGMWSPVRKAAGLAEPGYLGEWHAFRQYASGVTGPAAEHLHVWFDEDFLPGYAWSFPLPGGRANIGFGVVRAEHVGRGGRIENSTGSRRSEADGPARHAGDEGAFGGRISRGGEMKQQWAMLLDRPHIRAALGPAATMEDRHLAWPIPAAIDRAVLGHGRILLTGDAAMASDVMTGEGIGQALLTGRLAAEAVLAAGALQPHLAVDRYTRAVGHHLVADHRMSRALNRVLAHRRGADGAIAVLAGAGEWGRRSFARWMFEDEPRAIAATPRRWHRRFLAQPGV
ncbi:MAG: NAD(P)/FAD-dependent oxidoreductase [Actinomycetota bacterium]|nr:NAD(P)/FAD-dependent oxidoreductase [Actinomycetota bacterium]